MSAQMKLPANHTALHEDEMMYITGGASVETVVKAVVAVGGTAALLVVGGIALRAILNVLGGQRGLSGVVEDSIARLRPELHRRRAGHGSEFPERPAGPVKRASKTQSRHLLHIHTQTKRQSTLTGRSAFCSFMQFRPSFARGAALQTKKKRIRILPRRGLGSDTPCLVDGTGLEPVTSCTSSRCSTS